MSLTPSAATVLAGGQQEVTVRFDPATLPDAAYHVDLHVSSLIYDSTMVLPVTLIVHRTESAGRLPQGVPSVFSLHQNFPNPFNPTTSIRYDLKSGGFTRLSVYNVLGEKVADLVNARQPAGYYEINFNASALPSGVYFYRLTSGSFVQSEKMLLLK